MKVLVLGSEGQVGKYLVTQLVSEGHSVTTLDLRNDPSEDLRLQPNPKLETAVSEADYVFFLAFDVGGSKYLATQQGTFDFFHNNVRINANVFEQLHKWKKKFVYTSSQMSNMADSSYGFLKMMGEKYCTPLSPLGVVVRFWNVYGIEEDDDKAHVITDFVKMALEDRVIRMRTDGEEQRQFLYGGDCAKALTCVMGNHDEVAIANDSIDITSFEYVSISQVARQVASIAEKYTNSVEVLKGTASDTIQSDKRNEPNKRILEFWSPVVNLETGIELVLKQHIGPNRS